MSITTDEYENTDNEGSVAADIQSLRDAAKRGKAASEKAAKLERENAFLRAGVDPDDPKLGYFYRGYNGELSSDAIKAAAIEAGFINPPQADPAVQQHAQGQQAVDAASAGVEAVYDPQGAIHSLEQAFAEGGVEAMIAAGQQYGLRIARP